MKMKLELQLVLVLSILLQRKEAKKFVGGKKLIHHSKIRKTLNPFSIKNIFYDKMDLRLFYFHELVIAEVYS